MTIHEHFVQITGHEEPVHIEAFSMIISELQENNPEIDFDWCLPKYKGVVEWLNSEFSRAKEGKP